MGDIVDDWPTTGVENMLKSNSIKFKLKAEPCYTLIWNGTSEIYVGYTKQQRDGQRSKDKCYDQIIVMCPFENNLFS